jgi:Na+/H+-dicarboxylate symporter/ABC-type amino acid transport substrate-binding protein
MQRQPPHSPEFRARVALEALAGLEPIEELAARHGVSVAEVTLWRDRLKERSPGLFRSRRRQLLELLWPRSLGRRCLQAIVMGALLGRMLPASATWLAPLGVIGLQASQMVVMPYLVCEVLHALGSLPRESMAGLMQRAGTVLVLLLLLGSLTVVAMPAMLPALVASDFFTPALLAVPDRFDLLRTYVPANLFEALASDNVPAVVLICAVLGVLLQGHAERNDLLRPLAVLRTLFRDLNRIVAGLIPLSIVALTARSSANTDPSLLLKLQGLFWITLVAGLAMTLLLPALLLAFTPLRPRQLWRLSAGPLGLAFGSGNALVALPPLLANLRQLLAHLNWLPAERRPQLEQEMTASVAVAYALPGLGQVMALVCVPFLGWYLDQPMGPAAIVRYLAIGVPSVMGGLKAAIREGLRLQGLPLDLLQVVDLTGVWLYRFEKVMTVLGLITLALLVATALAGKLRLRLPPLLLGLGLAAGLSWLGGVGVRGGLARALEGRYSKDQVVLRRLALERQPELRAVPLPPPAPLSLPALRARGVLRVGVRREAMPWAYRNAEGAWVGFDLDLLRSLARDMGLKRIDLVEGNLPELEGWLDQGRLDLVAGGVAGSPGRAARFFTSEPYLRAHLALVVDDQAVPRIQSLDEHPLGRPLRLALLDRALETPLLREQLTRRLGHGGTSVVLVPIASKEEFFSKAGRHRFDGLLTTAEGGAAWAVVHPDTTLLAPFADALPVRLVLLIGGSDPNLADWVNGWIATQEAQGGVRRLYEHWILMGGGDGARQP